MDTVRVLLEFVKQRHVTHESLKLVKERQIRLKGARGKCTKRTCIFVQVLEPEIPIELGFITHNFLMCDFFCSGSREAHNLGKRALIALKWSAEAR